MRRLWDRPATVRSFRALVALVRMTNPNRSDPSRARLDSRGDRPYINEKGADDCIRPYTSSYTSPWSSMALATFKKPPMLAPFTRLPGVPYFSAVSKQF